VDGWISQQFRKKDFKIEGIVGGLIVCDRSPLDPLAFAKSDARSIRAREHIEAMAPQASSRRLAKGHVIFLTATGGELLSRAKHRHLEATDEYLENQQTTLQNLYQVPNSAVTEISTCGRNLSQVVRNVAKAIHLGTYTEIDIHQRIEEISRGE